MADKPLFKQLLWASTVGLNFVISTVIGGLIGYGLDSAMEKWFGVHTEPWLLFVFALLGIIAGFRELLRMATKKENESTRKKNV
jgi:ATP synthase protein I